MGYEPQMIRTTLEINERQAVHVVELVQDALGSLRGKKVALLGLAFKPDTDDVRETRAYPIAWELVKRGAAVTAYDPMAMDNFRKEMPVDGLRYSDSADAAP
jgi:UDPglucose 6-dehydrogenase